MRFPRFSIVLTIIVLANIWVFRNHTRISTARRNLASMETELATLRSQCASHESEMAATQTKIQTQTRARNIAQATLSAETRKIAEAEPERLWADPPAQLPEWNSESPYVWLSKDILPRLPATPFSETGELDSQAAAVLTLSEQERARLNASLRSSLAEYRALEAANVQITTNHVPGISQFPGEKLTIQVKPLPEQGEHLKNEFISSVKAHLGEQRSGLVLRLGRGWLSEHFNHEATRPKTISVARHANGTFNITVQTGGSSMSVGGQTTLDNYIPTHLLPFFTSLQSSEASKM